MVHIFISYARTDGLDIAATLANKLRSLEHEVFLDIDSIRAGVQWEAELHRRVRWSDILIIIVTPGANESDYVFKEFKYAEKNGKVILPVQVGDTQLPVHLRGTWHAIKVNGKENISDVIPEILHHAAKQTRRIHISPASLLISFVILTAIIIVIAFALPNLTSTIQSVSTTKTVSTPSSTNIPSAQPRVLYEQNFETGRNLDWQINYGKWEIVTENGGNKVLKGVPPDNFWAVQHFGSAEWNDYAVDFKFKFEDADAVQVGVRSQINKAAAHYALVIDRKQNSIGLFRRLVEGTKWKFADEGWIYYQPSWVTNYQTWNTVHIEVKGKTILISVNDKPLPIYTDNENLYPSGYVTLLAGPSGQALFDDIRVYALES